MIKKRLQKVRKTDFLDNPFFILALFTGLLFENTAIMDSIKNTDRIRSKIGFALSYGEKN